VFASVYPEGVKDANEWLLRDRAGLEAALQPGNGTSVRSGFAVFFAAPPRAHGELPQTAESPEALLTYAAQALGTSRTGGRPRACQEHAHDRSH
jgi:hypothetical protein